MWQHLARVVVTSLLIAGPAVAATGAPSVTYRDDKLSVSLQKVPVGEGVTLIEKAIGADVRGRVPSEGEISIDFENVPLHEALGRLFGERNFAITYGADGRATAIELFGAPLPAPPKAAAVETSAAPVEPTGWPPDEKTKAAVATLRTFLERNPSVDLDPELAKVAGAKTTTFIELMRIAAQNDDRRVRARAWNESVRTMRDDPEVWEALVVVMNTAPEDSMRDFARNQLGPNAEELTRQLIRHAGPQLRAPARAVLERLAADPTAGVAAPTPVTP